MSLDHDQHGNAAQPVEVWPPVHATMVCAVSRTMSSRSECQTEQYLSRDSAIARWTTAFRHLTVHVEVQRGLRDAVWNVGPSFRDDGRAESRQRVASLPDDVDDIHGHAGAEADDKHLNGRGACGAITVDDGCDPGAGDAERRSSSAQTSSAVTGGLGPIRLDLVSLTPRRCSG